MISVEAGASEFDHYDHNGKLILENSLHPCGEVEGIAAVWIYNKTQQYFVRGTVDPAHSLPPSIMSLVGGRSNG